MSKHKNRRKVRTPAVRVDFGREQILSGMHVSADGTLTFFEENGQRVTNVEVDSTYPRKKGPKTLARVVSNPDKIVLDQNRALSRYDYLFAIDTNTKVVNSVKTSGLFNAHYRPLYERLTTGSRAAVHRASAMLVTPLARAMLSA